LSHSSLIADGATVMTRAQTYELGTALMAVQEFFDEVYDENGFGECTSFYAMDVEFKLDDLGTGEPKLFIKQARPHPGWGL
jgi:hypothetical protein